MEGHQLGTYVKANKLLLKQLPFAVITEDSDQEEITQDGFRAVTTTSIWSSNRARRPPARYDSLN